MMSTFIFGNHLSVHIVTADTYGKAVGAFQALDCHLAILPPSDQAIAKADYIRHLGSDTVVAIGNGRNDRLMLQQAAIGLPCWARGYGY